MIASRETSKSFSKAYKGYLLDKSGKWLLQLLTINTMWKDKPQR